jgi:beta-galactosidase
VVATYAGGFLHGRPAIIDNALGAGRVVYIGTRLDDVALRDTMWAAVRAAGVSRLLDGAPASVEVCRRVNDQAEFLFLLNHSDTEAATIAVPAKGLDLLSGAVVDGSVVLAPRAVAVVRVERQ